TWQQNGGSLSILLGDGDGTFGSPQTIASGASLSGIFAIAAGDFNGDGKLYFAYTLGPSANTISIFLCNGDRTFQSPIPTNIASPHQLLNGLAVGDVNHDGKTDIALPANAPQQGAGTVLLLSGNGDGTFATPASYPIAAAAWSIVPGDFNGEGKLDLATAAS